jgi:hypothetical protein
MTDWSDPLVIATFGLVAVTSGLFIATAFYARYTKSQVSLLKSQEKVQIAQNRVLKANVEMMKLVTQSQFRGNPNWFDQEAERILSELKSLATEEPIIGSNSTPASKPLSTTRAAIVFGASCFAIALVLLGLQLINHYFEVVVSQKYATYADWIASVLIAGFFGGLMVGSLILVFPYDLLERVRSIRRGKKLFGLS